MHMAAENGKIELEKGNCFRDCGRNEMASHLYLSAAGLGNKEAMKELISLYSAIGDNGVPVNEEAAKHWRSQLLGFLPPSGLGDKTEDESGDETEDESVPAMGSGSVLAMGPGSMLA